MGPNTYSINNVPNIFFLASTNKIDNILPESKLIQENLSFDGILRNKNYNQNFAFENDQDIWIENFIRIKKEKLFYNQFEMKKFKVWDYSSSQLLDCTVTYNDFMPNQQFFSPNGISSITEGREYIPITSQEIQLPEGWSIFSTYLNLENMDISVALNPIQEQLVIVKDYLGMAYLLEWNYNGIGDIILGHAYQVKVNQEIVLEFEGDYTFPNDVPLVLPEGWSLLGYLRTNPADCVAVFDAISDEIVLVKNYLGNAYIPNWNFNGIGDLLSGQGYQIKMNSTQVLLYNSNEAGY